MRVDPAISKAASVLDTLSLDDHEREIYEGKLKWLRDEAGTLKKAEIDGYERGLERGIAEGQAMARQKIAPIHLY